MIAVIFEVEPAPGHNETYLDTAAGLRPLLYEIEGFISVERFQSLTNPGKLVSLSFFAKWCSTCLLQEKVFHSFQGDTSVPGTLLVVDYDQSRQIMKKLRVHTQSTLIVFQGHVEIHRSAGITDPRFLRAALQATQ